MQLFKSSEAQLGERTVQVPYYLQAGVSATVLAHLKNHAQVGDELDVVLDDGTPSRYAMRLVHYLTTDDRRPLLVQYSINQSQWLNDNNVGAVGRPSSGRPSSGRRT